MDDWGECSNDEEEEDVEIKETGVCGDLSMNGGDGEEIEVYVATLHDVHHTNLHLSDSLLELADFILPENCFLVNLSPDVTLKDVDESHGESGNAEGGSDSS